jgi:hypothetical protein
MSLAIFDGFADIKKEGLGAASGSFGWFDGRNIHGA